MRRGSAYADDTYSTVKAFAFKGSLLPYPALESLAEARNLDDLVTRLKGTVYAEYVAALDPPFTARRIELALRQHLASLHYRLMMTAPDGDLLQAYYFRYLISNLRNVLKGKALRKSHDELAEYVDLYAEELIGRRDLLLRGLSAETVDSAVGLLAGTELGVAAANGLRVYKEKNRIEVFDLFLDREFFALLATAYEQLERGPPGSAAREGLAQVRPLVAPDVDGFNALAVLRGRLWDLPPGETRNLLVTLTFDLDAKLLERMLGASTVKEAVRHLSLGVYRGLVPSAERDEELVTRLEENFRLEAVRRARRPFLWNVFGLGLALGIVKLKELELANLGAIAFGVEEGRAAPDILPKLTVLR